MNRYEINPTDPFYIEALRQFTAELDLITRRDPLMQWIVRCDDHRRITGWKLTFKTNRHYGTKRNKG